MGKIKKFLLTERDIPKKWYNVMADMPNKPMPILHPGTKKPIQAEDLYPLFAKELVHQEINDKDVWIDIPEEVLEKYKIYRPAPLVEGLRDHSMGISFPPGPVIFIFVKRTSRTPFLKLVFAASPVTLAGRRISRLRVPPPRSWM